MTESTQVELRSRTFAYPADCPCCGAAADTELSIRLRPTSRVVSSDTARTMLFPYCSRCIEHVEIWETGSMTSALLVLAGTACAIVNLTIGNLALGVVAFTGAIALAVFATAMFRSRARASCRPSCATANKAVRYFGWSGSTSAFAFASPTYTARFAEHNETHVVSADAALRTLLEHHAKARRLVPTPAAANRVVPPPLSTDEWLDQLAAQPTRVARRAFVARALDAGHDERARALLVDLACQAELATLQVELSGRPVATRRRLVDAAIEAARADNLPEPLRDALIAKLEAWLPSAAGAPR